MIGLDGTAAAGRRSEAATTVFMQRPVLISAATHSGPPAQQNIFISLARQLATQKCAESYWKSPMSFPVDGSCAVPPRRPGVERDGDCQCRPAATQSRKATRDTRRLRQGFAAGTAAGGDESLGREAALLAVSPTKYRDLHASLAILHCHPTSGTPDYYVINQNNITRRDHWCFLALYH